MARILISGLILLFSFALPLWADDLDRFETTPSLLEDSLWTDNFGRFKTTTRLFLDASHFYWDEHDGGAKLLDETGMLYGVGVSLDDICSAGKSFNPEVYRLTFGGKVQYFFGTVDYDGQTMDGDPAQTDVDYSGFTLEAYLGAMIKIGSHDWFVEPKLTLGYRNWSRDILTTAQAVGYKEKWQTCYSRLGATAVVFLRESYRLSLTGGAIIPLWAVNDVHIWGYDVGVSPKPFYPTPYAEVALEYKRVGLAAYYEAFRFGESDVDEVGLFQPESYEERFGVRLTVAFY